MQGPCTTDGQVDMTRHQSKHQACNDVNLCSGSRSDSSLGVKVHQEGATGSGSQSAAKIGNLAASQGGVGAGTQPDPVTHGKKRSRQVRTLVLHA